MSYYNIKIAKKYAKVLFDLSSPDKLDLRRDKLFLFVEIFKNAKSVLLSPIVQFNKKIEILNLLFEKLNEEDKELKNFIRVMLDNKRLGILEDVLACYDEIVKEYRKIASFELTVARELDENVKEEISSKLATIVKNKVDIKWAVEPNIIGGIIIKCGDKLLDASIKGEINNLASQIM
ncbi:MAG: ATP synthase F1 subunit delta [Bdellovibrionota bacterium]